LIVVWWMTWRAERIRVGVSRRRWMVGAAGLGGAGFLTLWIGQAKRDGRAAQSACDVPCAAFLHRALRAKRGARMGVRLDVVG
jgi:hypothetical protein